MRVLIQKTIIMGLLFLSLAAHSLSLEQQRDLYRQGQQALQRGKVTQAKQIETTLHKSGYPLYAYLEYARLKTGITQKKPDAKAIEAFIKAQNYTLLEVRLRSDWLTYLANQHQWENFLADYRDLKDPSLNCYNIMAQHRQGNQAILKEAVPAVWLSGYSRPKACDEIVDDWIKEGHLTQALVWQRIELAIDAKNYKFANHLKKYLKKPDQIYVQTWIDVARDPKQLNSPRLFRSNHAILRKIQVEGLEKLARQNIDKAIQIFNKMPTSRFTAEERNVIYGAFALELAMEHDPRASVWYTKLRAPYSNFAVHEWEVRNALWNGQWKQVLIAVNKMPPELKKDPTWGYWQGRALLELGRKEAGTKILTEICRERQFPGFMACDAVALNYPFDLPVIAVSTEDTQRVQKNPGVARALEFYHLRKIPEARLEWSYATRWMPEIDLQAASQIAYKAGWYDRAILTLSQAENKNNTQIRFPVVYKEEIMREAQRQGLDPAWMFAITRRESAFMKDAKSSAGALGLMQLMPRTAKHVAKQIKEPYAGPQQLVDTRKNTRLGAAYLDDLYKRMDNNMILATAAYNAGPSRVKQWLPPENLDIPPDVWIENVPFYETREYIKSILVYRLIYQQHISKKSDKLSTSLQPIR